MKLFTADGFKDELPFDFDYKQDLVVDYVLNEEEIKFALFKMRNRKAPGLSRISVNVLKQWYRDAQPENDDKAVTPSALQRWDTTVKIIQDCFRGEIPTAFTLGALVIIPKDDNGGVRGIGLLESIHKLIS